MKAKICGLSHLIPVKAVETMNKSTVPIFTIAKVADLFYTKFKKEGEMI